MRPIFGWAAAIGAVAAGGHAQGPVRITDVSPAAPRAGTPVQITADAPAGAAVRVCLVPMTGASRCQDDEGDGIVTFDGPYPGRWTVTAESAGQTVARRVRVRPRGGRLGVLVVGDSLVSKLA